jgi:hypothetical protein
VHDLLRCLINAVKRLITINIGDFIPISAHALTSSVHSLQPPNYSVILYASSNVCAVITSNVFIFIAKFPSVLLLTETMRYL